jgi:hypothetical protein
MAFDNPNDIQMAFLISLFRMKKERSVDLLFFIFNRKNRLFQTNFNGL